MFWTYCEKHSLAFNPQEAVGMVHLKGYMYKWIMEDLGKTSFHVFRFCLRPATKTPAVQLIFVFLRFTDKFILRGDETDAVLHQLASNGKKLFLITNSPFSFV